MKTLLHTTLFSFLVLGAFALPASTFASTIYVDTNRSEFSEGDTILFNVRIDSEGKKINAVEGEIVLDHGADAVSLVDIGTSGSQFSLWPENPQPSERNNRISFTGGAPGGLVSDDAIIFSFALRFNTAGPVSLSPNKINVYLHDGKGTQDKVREREILINVRPNNPDVPPVNEWTTVLSNDTTPPEAFEIFLGQDNAIFDGRKFLSFNAIDKESGISHYEVLENDLPPIRSGNTYILQNQDATNIDVTVVAYDAAGNERKSVYKPTSRATSYINTIIIIVGVILFFIVLFIVIFKTRSKKTRRRKNERRSNK